MSTSNNICNELTPFTILNRTLVLRKLSFQMMTVSHYLWHLSIRLAKFCLSLSVFPSGADWLWGMTPCRQSTTNDGNWKLNGKLSHQFPSRYQVVSALPGAYNYHNTVYQSQVISHLWKKSKLGEVALYSKEPVPNSVRTFFFLMKILV